MESIQIGTTTINVHENSAEVIPLDAARELFEHLSAKTWTRINHSEVFNVPQGEESITDFNLLEIASSAVKTVTLWKCPKQLEAQFGIDWDWVIGSDALGWRRYAVQAKKIGSSTGKNNNRRYDNLDHQVPIGKGKNAPKISQIDLLNAYAQKESARPIYCLYNYSETFSAKAHWHCCSFKPEKEQLGCSVSPSHVIAECIAGRGKRSFKSIHLYQTTIPWRCLLCCPHIFNADEKLQQSPSILGQTYGVFDNYHRSIPQSLRNWLHGESHLTMKDAINVEDQDIVVYPERIAIIEIENPPILLSKN